MGRSRSLPSPPLSDEDAVAAADKEMEERANRAKALLSSRYKGLKAQQVRRKSPVTVVLPAVAKVAPLY